MGKKLIFLLALRACLLWLVTDHTSAASDMQKKKAVPILANGTAQLFYPMTVIGKDLCTVYSDSNSVAYYFPDTIPGNGFALYMDPQTCGPDPYPFKITGTQLYLRDYSNGLAAEWPVEIRVNIRDLKEDSSWFSPGPVLCYQTFSLPVDSSYDSLDPEEEPIYLSLDSLNPSPCLVESSFFLEIIFTGNTPPPFPGLVMGDPSLDLPDTCAAWFLYDKKYYEWSEIWETPVPGCPIMRTIGYTHFIGVEEEEQVVTPENFELFQNHPNPFNSNTIIKYTLSRSCRVSLVIYNILGQKVRTLVTEYQKPGVRSVSWDGTDEKGKDLASGVYFYQLTADEATQTKRMILFK